MSSQVSILGRRRWVHSPRRWCLYQKVHLPPKRSAHKKRRSPVFGSWSVHLMSMVAVNNLQCFQILDDRHAFGFGQIIAVDMARVAAAGLRGVVDFALLDV